jgi:hypothetical protein
MILFDKYIGIKITHNNKEPTLWIKIKINFLKKKKYQKEL